ncbi:MAG TPA: GGDEF domain-containing protein [Pseudonocardiaceae bacterium]|nr:GGDEF domain-containing protein [Pseudonocardiaceae bacterium]
MPALLDDVHFAFAPMFNLRTGGVVAVEALARPPQGGARELLRTAADTGQLTPTDYGLVTLALARAAEHQLMLPLHVNLLAISAARAHVALEPVIEMLRATGRRATDVVIELNPPFASVRRKSLLRGIELLRKAGFRLALDGVGDGDLPLTLLTTPEIEIVKLDRAIIADVQTNPRSRTTIEAVGALCARNNTQLIADGVRSMEQLAALHVLGVGTAQGEALHPAKRRPPVRATITPPPSENLPTEPITPAERRGGPRVTELMHPATTLSLSATAEEVRAAFAAAPLVNSIVLLDEAERPQWTIDRNRFLLAVTGPYGHALHANRSAKRLGETPRVIPIGASVFDVLDVLGGSDLVRTNDDVVVVDAAHRCLGVVRVTDLVRAVADSKIEQAAALNPLTRLPGSESIAREVGKRITSGEVFAVGWLDIDSFKSVNDEFGFAVGDDLIRQIGAGLAAIGKETPSVRVGHVGGDDFLFVASLDDVMPLGSRLMDGKWTAEGEAVTVSLAMLVCVSGSVSGYHEVSQLLAPLKHRAKSINGSSWVVGRPGTAHVDVLRQGSPVPRQGGRHVSAAG